MEEEEEQKSLDASLALSQKASLKEIDNIRIDKTIGEGTFGKVKLGIHLPTREQVAIKVLEKEKIVDEEDMERITREIHYLKLLKHPNIIKIYQIIEDEMNYYIIMEYAKGGELFNYIVKKKRLSEQEASFFYNQIISGLEFIHKHSIVHRDLKPENLLLTLKNELKIIDFGLSNKYSKRKLLSTPCGSPCYAAPEMILGKKYEGIMIDLWSSGIILYAMICGYLPFEDKNNDKLYKKILNCKYDLPDKISPACKDLIRKLLTVNPKKRIRLEEVKQHPFMKVAFDNIYHSNSSIIHVNQGAVIDGEVFEQMGAMGYDREDIISHLKNKNHNGVTTTYELLLKQKRERSNNLNAANNKIIAIPFAMKKDQVTVNIKENPKKLKKGIRDFSATMGGYHHRSKRRSSASKERDNSLDMMNLIKQNNIDTNIIMSSPPGLPFDKNNINRKLPKKRRLKDQSSSPQRNAKSKLPPPSSSKPQFLKAIDTSITYDSNSKKKSNKVIYIPSNTINLIEDEDDEVNVSKEKKNESINVASKPIQSEISISSVIPNKNYHRSYSQKQREKKKLSSRLTPIDELISSYQDNKAQRTRLSNKKSISKPSVKAEALCSSESEKNKKHSALAQKGNKKELSSTCTNFSPLTLNSNDNSITIINTNHTINNFYLSPFESRGYNSVTSRTPTHQHNERSFLLNKRKASAHLKTKNTSENSISSESIQTEPRAYSPKLYSNKFKQLNKRSLAKRPAIVDIDITTSDKKVPKQNSTPTDNSSIEKASKQLKHHQLHQYTHPNANSKVNSGHSTENALNLQSINPPMKKASKKPSSIALRQSLITAKRTNEHIYGFVDLSNKGGAKKKVPNQTNQNKQQPKPGAKSKQKRSDTTQFNSECLFISQKSFASCTTTSSPIDIEEKIASICKESCFVISKKEKDDIIHFTCTNSIDNTITIELNKTQGKNLLKLYHATGNEHITKEVIKKIIVSVDF